MTNSQKQSLSIKFDGDITPESVRGKDLAEVLEAFEDIIASKVVENEPDLSKEEVKICLVEIKIGSLETTYRPNFQSLTIPAAEEITALIRNKNLSVLSESSKKSLKRIIEFTNKYQCEANISLLNGTKKKLATITPNTEIPSPTLIKGETTLYGVITRVGGKEPRIQFTTIDGQLIYCASTHELAKEAGQKLYTDVGINGVAEWDSKTHSLVSFELKSISNYQRKECVSAFEKLAREFGKEFDLIDDVAHFAQTVRYGKAEE